MATSELPRPIGQLVQEFEIFYAAEIERVADHFSSSESGPIIASKEVFIQAWNKANDKQGWKAHLDTHLSATKPNMDCILSQLEKELLWEEIRFEITEPLALAFRKKKAEFLRSLTTFGKMLAAAGFLAGAAYSLYMYGVRI